MNSFLDPVGARPPVVYWRRRALVAAALAVLVMLLAKSCGGAAPDLRSNASSQGPVPLVSTYTPTPKPTEKVLDGGADAILGVRGGGGGGGGGGIGSGGTSTSARSGGTGIGSGGAASAAKPLAAVRPAATPTPTPTPTATKTPTPAPQKAAMPVAVTTCKKSAMAVTLRSDQRTYSGKKAPQLFIAVKNVGDVGCLVDLGSQALTLVVKSGSDRVWSSDDCQGKGTSDIRLLKPGQSLEARSVWSKVRSEPGCPKGMTHARPGTYLVEGSAGGVKAKKRAVFQLT